MKTRTLLNELFAAAIVYNQMFCIVAYAQTGLKFYGFFAVLWTLCIFALVWYAFNKRFEENRK